MNNKISDDNNNNPPGLKKAARIVFYAVIVLLCCVSSANPLGFVSLPFTVTAAALIINLSLGYDKKDPRRAAVFILILPSIAASLLLYPVGTDKIALTASLAAVLFPYVLALPIILCLRHRTGRTASIASAAVASLLLWFAAGALIHWLSYSALDAASIGKTLDRLLEPLRAYLAGFTYESGGETLQYFSEADIENLVGYTKSVLLGTAAAIMVVIAYFVTLLTRLVARSFDRESIFPVTRRIHVRRIVAPDGPTAEFRREDVVWRINLDNVTAFIYIASYMASVLLASPDGGVSVPGATAQNLTIMLTPGFVYAGIREIMAGFGGTRTNLSGCLTFAAAAVLVFINPLMLVILLAVIGVVSTIRENLRIKQIKPR